MRLLLDKLKTYSIPFYIRLVTNLGKQLDETLNKAEIIAFSVCSKFIPSINRFHLQRREAFVEQGLVGRKVFCLFALFQFYLPDVLGPLLVFQ